MIPTTTVAPWEVKANRLIAALCLASWKEANTSPNGSRRNKHRPYTVPELAERLVGCLGMKDRHAAEVEAKSLFLSYDGLQALGGPKP